MADMGLPLAYGAGTAADELARLVKERLLIQEQQRRQAELEWQRQYQGGTLGIAQSQEGRASEKFGLEKPGLEWEAQNAPVVKGLGLRKIQGEVDDADYDRTRTRGINAEIDAAATDPANPNRTIIGLRRLGVPTAPLDTQLDDKQTQAMDLAKYARGTQFGVADRYSRAQGGAGGLTRGTFRTIPTLASGRFGIPKGRKVTGFFNGPDLIWETVSPPTAGMTEKGADLGTIYTQLEKIKQKYLEHPDSVGVAGGWMEAGANALGYQWNKNKAEMAAALQTMDNMLIYARSGKQINEEEYKRLKKELPDVKMDPPLFETRLRNVEAGLLSILQNYEQMGATGGREFYGDVSGAQIGGASPRVANPANVLWPED